jgi:hypothetical protein
MSDILDDAKPPCPHCVSEFGKADPACPYCKGSGVCPSGEDEEMTDILDDAKALQRLEFNELDRLTIRTGCETDLNRRADTELRRRGYRFDPHTQSWRRTASEHSEGQSK